MTTHFVNHCGYQQVRRQVAMALQTVEEALLAELFTVAVEGLGDAVGVERERVTCEEPGLAHGTVPILEESEDGSGGGEAFYTVIAANEQRREMPAIGVAQASRLIVVFREEKRGIGAIGRVLTEEAVDRAQETLRFFDRHGALTAQIGLQIGHEESGGNSLAGDVADYQAKPLPVQSQEIVVIAAHLESLNAASCVIQGFQGR